MTIHSCIALTNVCGVTGPILLEDYHLIEKLAQFDRERIPERVVHARGATAKGFFEVRQLTLVCYSNSASHLTAHFTTYHCALHLMKHCPFVLQVTHDISHLTCADVFRAPGVQTPVITRFSTVIHERGSPETLRDPRGFAVKFYTREGNWDLVGNNMPVFFIRDGIKFPDMIHALKPNPKNHIQEWWRITDFFSHVPESMHMVGTQCLCPSPLYVLLCVQCLNQAAQWARLLVEVSSSVQSCQVLSRANRTHTLLIFVNTRLAWCKSSLYSAQGLLLPECAACFCYCMAGSVA